MPTIIQLAFFFNAFKGNPITKFVKMESHFQVGIFDDQNSLIDRSCFALIL